MVFERALPGRWSGTLGQAVLLSLIAHLVLLASSKSPATGQRRSAELAQSGYLQVRLRPVLRQSAEPNLRQSDSQAVAPTVEQSVRTADIARGADVKATPQSSPGLATTPLPLDVLPTRRYYLPREVDQPSAPLDHAELVYPEAAMRKGIGGFVVMHLYIGPDGSLERTEVVRAEPAGVFDDAVRDAARKTKFRPAMLNQVPVGSRITIEVPFDPTCSDFETCNSSSSRK